MKKVRVGILGGSFNPPHSGHLHISNIAIKKLKLTQLWWIPTLQNPLKTEDIKDSYTNRMILCKEITKDNPKIKIKNFEQRFFSKSEKSYTYNLLKRLNHIYPNYEFYFIMGADSLVVFYKWHKFREIAKLAKIVVFNRPGFSRKTLGSKIKKVYYQFIFSSSDKSSSTEIRKNKNH